MKLYKIFKVVLGVLLIFVLYLLIGVLASYARQPEISDTTRKNTNIDTYYRETSQVPERASVIEENGEALKQRVRLIENAEEEIILSTFAFHADNSGKIVIGALLNAANRGVKIRILADGFESWTSIERNPYFYALVSNENVVLKIYNRANPLKLWKIMGRMHDKYLIADSQVYLLGGRNTYDYFLGDFPGHKNYDRDVLVYCENPQEDSSVRQLEQYFETIWKMKECVIFKGQEDAEENPSVKKALEDAQSCYQKYADENAKAIHDREYRKDTLETENIELISNPIYTQAKEPIVWYQLAELMKGAKQSVKIHTPYIICNQMMYDTWEEIAEIVPQFSIMTNSVANNGNPFGSADYLKNKEKILNTGIDVLEYEGGYSYHGKSILIDDNISIVGSFNMDMRSTYLDTELMLVIRSKEVNEQLAANMNAYERQARQALKDGKYNNPYNVTPVALTKKRERRIFLVKNLLGWARFLL